MAVMKRLGIFATNRNLTMPVSPWGQNKLVKKILHKFKHKNTDEFKWFPVSNQSVLSTFKVS